MRVLLAPHGTRGDVQPMLALAVGLRERGHDVTFLAPDNFVTWIRSWGFACEPDGVNVEAVLKSPGGDFSSLRWQMHHVKNVLVPALFESFMRIETGVDLIVGAGVQVAAPSVAEWKDVPFASVVFCPCAVPNSDAPPPTVRTQALPRWVNRLLWDLSLPLGGLAVRRPINDGRRRLGLTPVANPLSILGRSPVIVAADRELAPLPHDVPRTVVGTDAWILDEPAPTIDPQLDEFLNRNPSPVYVGFGSMVAKRVSALAAHAVDAARALGRPLVLSAGWAELDRHVTGTDDVFAIGSVPHSVVFPRVAAVVHHGGAGTTTAAARAGAPQVILPHLLDQYYWARRVEQLGIGPSGLPVDLVTADILTERLATALEDYSIRERTRALAPAIAGRNGVAAAVDHLERLLAPASPAASGSGGRRIEGD